MPADIQPPEDAFAEVAELYDLDCGEYADDIAFYENLARRCEGPVLELGVGTGRVAIPLAEAGFEVWGIDASEAMVARARRKAGPELEGRLHLLPGRMEEFDVGREFDLVFAAFGTFHHLLTPEDQTACLRSVEGHLAPGGLFACDLRPLVYDDWEAGDSVPVFHDWTRAMLAGGEIVTKLRSVRADRARQVKRETHIYDRISAEGVVRRTVAVFDLRFVSRYEMEGLLRTAGLELDQLYGDFDLAPYDDESNHMITIARRAREES